MIEVLNVSVRVAHGTQDEYLNAANLYLATGIPPLVTLTPSDHPWSSDPASRWRPVVAPRSQGILTAGEGPRYFPEVYVLVRLLREVGCQLPIEVWTLPGRADPRERRSLEKIPGVRVCDLAELPVLFRRCVSYELKTHALKWTCFDDVLWIDADNTPTRDPSYLLTGAQDDRAIFWPDIRRFGRLRSAWRAFGVPSREDREFETGQIVLRRSRDWVPLCLADWYNEHADYYYGHVQGDKDTFYMAWRYMGRDFAMPSDDPVCHRVDGGGCGIIEQHDFDGQVVFQHRPHFKFADVAERCYRMEGIMARLVRAPFIARCLRYVQSMTSAWHGWR